MDFKDKVKGISKKVSDVAESTYKTVADKSGKLVEEAKLKLRTNELESDIEKIYIELGEAVYEQYKAGQDVGKEASKSCKQVEKMLKEIKKMDTKILYMKNLRVCENCLDTIGVDNKFCPTCGEKQKAVKIKEEKKEEVAENKVCPECETVHGLDVNFCTKCGYKF